jgi:hypothetical protein
MYVEALQEQHKGARRTELAIAAATQDLFHGGKNAGRMYKKLVRAFK